MADKRFSLMGAVLRKVCRSHPIGECFTAVPFYRSISEYSQMDDIRQWSPISPVITRSVTRLPSLGIPSAQRDLAYRRT